MKNVNKLAAVISTTPTGIGANLVTTATVASLSAISGGRNNIFMGTSKYMAEMTFVFTKKAGGYAGIFPL